MSHEEVVSAESVAAGSSELAAGRLVDALSPATIDGLLTDAKDAGSTVDELLNDVTMMGLAFSGQLFSGLFHAAT